MEYQKTAESTGDLIGNKIANKITKVSKSSQQNSSEALRNKNETPKERHLQNKGKNYW